MQKKNLSWLWVPAAVTIVAGILLLLGTLQPLESGVYNMLLRLRPEPKELEAIVLMDFDDQAIEEAGSWPVPRNIYGDGLILLAELGAEYAVFDIEYVDESPRGVNTEFLEQDLPEVFREQFGGIGGDIGALFGAIANKQVSIAEAEPFVQDLVGRTESARDELLDNVRQVARDNDEYLARAARFFGNSFFTLNMRRETTPGADADSKLIAKDLCTVAADAIPGNLMPKAVDILPTINPILRRSGGAGFPNVYIDVEDGVRRRIDLFYEYDGQVYAQLVVAPLLRYLGNPTVSISRTRVVLKSARYPDGTTADIVIPLAEDGRMLIDWPHKNFIDSFRHISFKELMVHKNLYADLVHNLRIREEWGYLSLYDGERPLMEQAQAIDAYLAALLDEAADGPLPDGTVDDFRKARDAFLSEIGRYLDTRPEEAIAREIAGVLATPDLDEGTRANYETLAADAPAFFEATRRLHADLTDLRGRLAKALDGAFCILGQTGTSTTDIGVNPFESEYMNVGTHASVLNTIYQRSFIDDAPSWVPLLITAVSSFGLAFLIRKRKPLVGIGMGFGWTIVLAVVLMVVFAKAGIFTGMAQPVAAAFITFLASTLVSFLRTEREKGFLRSAFAHYLSDEVIKVIVDNPDKLQLGGTERRMTAMFTDIRGFSTVSEKLSPSGLVALLNRYLTSMSDIILDMGGTIDKYEGDAIIGFFNAPLDVPDHARKACLAAVRMKKAEAALNKELLEAKVAPSELLTRIGLNTGDMVVGNMGTTRKMDYTIIGDAVNLAARLEGVNKQYATWIMASEDTVAAAGDEFVMRGLDRIRVVGKSVPIQIFEVIDERAVIGDSMDAVIAQFEEGLKRFAAKDWKGAIAAFEKTMALKPGDGPAKTFIDRCKQYMVNPPPADWDGVFNLTMK